MTKKDFFRLLIKIFGVFALISTIFSALPSNISFVINEIDLIGIIWLVGTLVIVVVLFILLVYNPDTIIKWLKLDRGFDDDRIEFQNFNTNNILKLAIIVIGGILLLKNIPAFLSHTLFAFKSQMQSDFMNDRIMKYGELRDYIYWLTSFINVVLGYLMITNYSSISRWLSKRKSSES